MYASALTKNEQNKFARVIDRSAAAAAIDAFLLAIGRDPATEPDLVGTGARVTEAFVDELCAGYMVDTKKLLESNAIDGATEASTTSSIVVHDIPLVTMCPHHLLPATGTAAVAIEPRSKLIGLGTIAALVDAHARRLTLQEHIGERVVSDLASVLSPAWVGCRIVLSHGCMIARGEHAHGSRVETIAMHGASTAERLLVLGVSGARP
jgi:GTP cyclohydrolase IA